MHLLGDHSIVRLVGKRSIFDKRLKLWKDCLAQYKPTKCRLDICVACRPPHNLACG